MQNAQEDVKRLDRDMEKAFARIKGLEAEREKDKQKIEELRVAAEDIGKLSVYTARGLQEAQSRYKLVCFLSGDFKELVKTRFVEFLKNK